MLSVESCTGGWSPVVGHWWLVTGGWSLVGGHWWVVTGGWSLVVGRWWVVTGGWSLVGGHWWVVTDGWSLVVGHRWLVTGGWSLVVGHWWLVTCHPSPQGNPGTVTVLEGLRHGLQDGDFVTFKEVVGMAALNGTVHPVKGTCECIK